MARPHRRTRGTPAPETEALLDRYRAAMRSELADLLTEIRPAPSSAQLTIDGTVPSNRPKLSERKELWDLAIKLGRELSSAGAESAWAGLPAPVALVRPRPARQAPRLTKRERTALGAPDVDR